MRAEWPLRTSSARPDLSVESGVVSCIGGSGVAIGREIALITIDGTTYGLNSSALEANYPDLEALRIDNPAIPGVRLDLGTLISLAIRQCYAREDTP